jgi:nicotinamide-nucleotide amidase
MFETSVVEYLNNHYGLQGTIVSRVLRTIGLGESSMEDKIREYILSQKNPTIALLARNGEIHVRLTAKAETVEKSDALIESLEKKLRAHIGEYIFGTDSTTLEQTVGNLLLENKMHIAIAESCTGGALSSRITDVPGSSEYYLGGVVSYSNESKISLLGVTPDTVAYHGAVSPQTAVEMAKAVRAKFSADIGISTTGIAGPAGGSAEKPVGLVFIAISGPYGDEYVENRFTGQRTAIKSRTVNAALDLIRRYLKNSR